MHYCLARPTFQDSERAFTVTVTVPGTRFPLYITPVSNLLPDVTTSHDEDVGDGLLDTTREETKAKTQNQMFGPS